MAKPTPIPSAQRALATAIKALESISINTGIKGTAVKLGSEFVTDTNAVVADLQAVSADAQALVDGLNTMINKLAEATNTEKSEALIKEHRAPEVDDSITASEFVQAELNSTVPIERTTAPELFSASPSF